MERSLHYFPNILVSQKNSFGPTMMPLIEPKGSWILIAKCQIIFHILGIPSYYLFAHFRETELDQVSPRPRSVTERKRVKMPVSPMVVSFQWGRGDKGGFNYRHRSLWMVYKGVTCLFYVPDLDVSSLYFCHDSMGRILTKLTSLTGLWL